MVMKVDAVFFYTRVLVSGVSMVYYGLLSPFVFCFMVKVWHNILDYFLNKLGPYTGVYGNHICSNCSKNSIATALI